MNTKHTPGPWVLGDSDLYCSSLSVHCGTRQGHTTICRMVSLEYGIGGGEVEANARLIAAAPELLAVLERVQSMFSYQFEGGLTGCMADLSIDVRAAICKATGEQQ